MEVWTQTAIDTDLGFINVIRGGDAGPWVVCWPTLMGDHRSMQAFAELLVPRHRVLLIDPPGFGINRHISTWPPLAQQAALAHRLVDALDIDRFHWVGQGFGGHVGAELVTRVGYRILSLTLASSPFVQSARVNMVSRMISWVLYRYEFGRYFVARHLTQQMVTGNEAERELTLRHTSSALDGTHLSVLRKLQPTPQPILTRLRERLVPIAIPRLVLAGSMDNMVLPRDQRTVADVLGARYVEVDSGFMTFLAQPNACAHAVLAFFQDNPRPAAD